ncbi:hypothetical protein JTB14_020559 [Gonioctena quinquepunctata]|nr:hypothetical protein JTB14_020559 [Gonioctena quinquepunctata]
MEPSRDSNIFTGRSNKYRRYSGLLEQPIVDLIKLKHEGVTQVSRRSSNANSDYKSNTGNPATIKRSSFQLKTENKENVGASVNTGTSDATSVYSRARSYLKKDLSNIQDEKKSSSPVSSRGSKKKRSGVKKYLNHSINESAEENRDQKLHNSNRRYSLRSSGLFDRASKNEDFVCTESKNNESFGNAKNQVLEFQAQKSHNSSRRYSLRSSDIFDHTPKNNGDFVTVRKNRCICKQNTQDDEEKSEYENYMPPFEDRKNRRSSFGVFENHLSKSRKKARKSPVEKPVDEGEEYEYINHNPNIRSFDTFENHLSKTWEKSRKTKPMEEGQPNGNDEISRLPDYQDNQKNEYGNYKLPLEDGENFRSSFTANYTSQTRENIEKASTPKAGELNDKERDVGQEGNTEKSQATQAKNNSLCTEEIAAFNQLVERWVFCHIGPIQKPPRKCNDLNRAYIEPVVKENNIVEINEESSFQNDKHHSLSLRNTSKGDGKKNDEPQKSKKSNPKKPLKKSSSNLETIFETPEKECIMSTRKWKRSIKFENFNSLTRTRRRRNKAKKLNSFMNRDNADVLKLNAILDELSLSD